MIDSSRQNEQILILLANIPVYDRRYVHIPQLLSIFDLKELSHGIVNHFGHVQNYLKTERNLKITVY